jgi:hypothetical protein
MKNVRGSDRWSAPARPRCSIPFIITRSGGRRSRITTTKNKSHLFLFILFYSKRGAHSQIAFVASRNPLITDLPLISVGRLVPLTPSLGHARGNKFEEKSCVKRSCVRQPLSSFILKLLITEKRTKLTGEEVNDRLRKERRCGASWHASFHFTRNRPI